MTDELVPKDTTAAALFVENGLDPVLGGIKKLADEFTPNLETAAGRKEIASFAYKIKRSKVLIDSRGKELVADRKAEIKLVDQERKRARDFLDFEVERVRKPLVEWEEEEARQEEERRRIAEYYVDWDEALQDDAIFNRERELKRKEAEMARKEEEARQKAEAERLEKERLKNEARLKREAEEKVRLEAEEKIRKEKERAERLEREAKEAEEKAERDRVAFEEWTKLEAERLEKEKKEAEEKAERDRIAKEERAKLEAEQIEKEKKEAAERAEREKQEAIRLERERLEQAAKEKKEAEEREAAQQKAEAEALAASKKHRAKINNEILAAFSKAGVSEEAAKTVIRAVAKGRIPHMAIQY